MSWYLRAGLKPVGPFDEAEVRRRLLAGEVSPEDLLWKDGVDDWRPALLWPEFRAMSVPAFQEVEMVTEDDREWVVLSQGEGAPQTSGPFSLREIRDGLRDGRFKGTDHLWKKGMSGWARLESRPEHLMPADAATSKENESPSRP